MRCTSVPSCIPDRPSIAIASFFVLITASVRARRLAPTQHPSCSRRATTTTNLHDAYRDVAVLQKLYYIAEFKPSLVISLMEEDS